MDVDDKNEWKECIDIGGVRLPTGYYFGASAATGDLSGRLRVTRLRFTWVIPEVVLLQFFISKCITFIYEGSGY